MNQFRFDVHDRHFPYIVIALIAGVVGALMVVLAVKFTGLGTALVAPQPVEPVPFPSRYQIEPQQTHIPSLSFSFTVLLKMRLLLQDAPKALFINIPKSILLDTILNVTLL